MIVPEKLINNLSGPIQQLLCTQILSKIKIWNIKKNSLRFKRRSIHVFCDKRALDPLLNFPIRPTLF